MAWPGRLTGSGACRSGPRGWKSKVGGQPLFPVTASLLCARAAEGRESGGVSYQALIPFLGLTSPRAHLLTRHLRGLGFQHVNVGGTRSGHGFFLLKPFN